MKTYKLFRIKNGKLYPLYVEAKREIVMNEWLAAHVGEKVDETHVKASGCGGKLSLRPGFHSCEIPYTNWIGKRDYDGTLMQRKDTVWCECEVRGDQLMVTNRYGLRELPEGWYYFRTNTQQTDPWIISKEVKVVRILSNKEVDEICTLHGLVAQKREVA